MEKNLNLDLSLNQRNMWRVFKWQLDRDCGITSEKRRLESLPEVVSECVSLVAKERQLRLR